MYIYLCAEISDMDGICYSCGKKGTIYIVGNLPYCKKCKEQLFDDGEE